MPAWNLRNFAYYSLYGGVEFVLNNGDLHWGGQGKVSNDIYYRGADWAPWHAQDDHVGTWCWDGGGTPYQC
ncbi:MAG TPA: hypothetical protein VLA19_22750 [Herpetosiphonaceae bacterium]|nr:hypothetical protein [Herpetosiphonaceae bacterium]